MPTPPPVSSAPQALSTFAKSQSNGDGTATQLLSLQPLFRRTASGLVPVDPSVKASADRSAPAAAEGGLRPIRFGADASRVARLDLDAGPVTLSAPGLNIGAPQVEPDGVVYKGVAADTDLTYRVSASGLKEEVTLGSSSSPTSFMFHLSDPKGALGAASPTPGGGYRFANKVDDAIVELPPPFAYEQKSAGGDGGAPRDLSSASMTLVEAGDGWDLTVSVNPAWLVGKSFPVILDPTVSFSNGTAYDGGYVYRPNLSPSCPGCFGVNGTDVFARTGTYNDATYDYQPARTAFRFDLSTIPAGSAVSAASLSLYRNGCLCGASNDTKYCHLHDYQVELHAFTSGWDPNTATWDSLAPITSPGVIGSYTQPAFVNAGSVAPIGMTASQVQSWVNGANHGFSLMVSPSQPANWGGPLFASSDSSSYPHPVLSVTYAVTAPGAPTNVTATGANGSAQVSWTPPASTGGAAIEGYGVNAYNPDGSYTGIQVLAGATSTSVTVPGLTNGRAYYFGVFARNSVGYGAGGFSGFVTPAVPPGAPTSLQGSISTGWYHSLLGRPDGTVAAFGLNNVGQLGNNTTVDARVPTAVPGLSGVTQVAAGYAHSLALKDDGTVWAWGYNAYGNLGNNSTVQSNVPVRVAGLTGVVSVSTSFNHNLALKSDGTVWAWGYNSNGQLGNNTTTQSNTPVKVPGLASIVSVSAGYAHSLTLRSDGGVFAFGLNNGGQLGNGNTVDSHAPIQVANIVSAVAVDAGLAHSVALRGDGQVWTWGYNAYGQLGNNSTVQANVAIVVPGLSGVTAVSAHGGYDTMARKADGTLWAWGYNADGQLGNNSTIQSNVPIQVPGLAAVTQASAGIYHTLAAKADGGLAAFGDNTYGQLGNNTVVDSRVAVTPTGPGLAAQAAALVAAAGAQRFTVTWEAPAQTGGRPVTGYNLTLYRGSPGSGAFAATKTCSGPCRAATFDVSDNTTYHVSVAAVTGAGTGPAATSNSATTSGTLSGAGERDFFTFQTTNIDDRVTAKVNVGTGNLLVTSVDLSVPTVGGTRNLAHVYNSLALNPGATAAQSAVVGYGWRFSDAPDRRLLSHPDGSVTLISGSGNGATFTASTYTPPPGLDVNLVRNPDGTWILTYLQTAQKLTFRADGLLTSDADRNGNTLTIAYPAGGGYQTSISGTAGTAPGNTVNLVYGGPGGRMSSMSQTADGTTRTVTYDYDPGNNLYRITDPLGRVKTFGYDANRNLNQITNHAGQVTKFAYDSSRRVTSVTRVNPQGTNTVTLYDYSVPGHTKLTDAAGHPPVDYTVDAAGKVTAATDAKGNATATTYTPDAKVDTATNAVGGATTNKYEANDGDSLTSSDGPTGAKGTATYNSSGQPYLPDTVTGAMGNTSTFKYSGPGNLTSTENAMAAKAEIFYNSDGTVDYAKTPAGGITDYVYNTIHQLTSIIPPAGTSLRTQSFTYDGAGRRKTHTNGKGMTTTYTYDALDRTKTEAHSDGSPTVSYDYDNAGNLTSRVDASGTTGYGYDALNRLKTKTLPGGAVLGYGYDPVGNLTTATDAGGTTTYRYDKTNLLDQLTEPGGRTNVFAHDADRRRTDTWYNTNGPAAYDASGDNIIPPTGFAGHIKATFDTAGNLTRIKTTRASSDADANRVSDLTYTYTIPNGTTCAGAVAGRSTGTRHSVLDNRTGATTSYCYDSGERLTWAATAGGATYTYGYDINGNRTSGPEGTHTYNAANQATDSGSAYDANGNLTTSTAYPTLAYNGLDQNTSTTPAGQAAVPMSYAGTTNTERTTAGNTTYQNGLLGVQTQATTTCTLGLLCNTVTASFVRDPQGTLLAERIGNDEYYYAFDGLGSVIALIDAAGAQRAAYTYDPYGGHHTATALNGALPPNPWRYAGGHLDATGLYKYGARYYDPNIGRWTQQDTIDAIGDPANANRYAYVGDDPINSVDPSGYWECPGWSHGVAKFFGVGDFVRWSWYFNAERPEDPDSDKKAMAAINSFVFGAELTQMASMEAEARTLSKWAGRAFLAGGAAASVADGACTLAEDE